jgi:hypothetical protein
MESIAETIKKRFSVRNYRSRAIDEDTMVNISTFIDKNRIGPLGSDVRFRIVDGSAYHKDELRELGTCGLITGPRVFIAGAVRKNAYAMEDYGCCK